MLFDVVGGLDQANRTCKDGVKTAWRKVPAGSVKANLDRSQNEMRKLNATMRAELWWRDG